MGQITESFARTMLEQCARKEHPSLTVWEAEQLARAWLRLAEAERDAERLRDFAQWLTGCGYDFTRHEYFIANRHLLAARAADSADARCSETLGNAGRCVKPAGHDGQHSLFYPDGRTEAVSADSAGEKP